MMQLLKHILLKDGINTTATSFTAGMNSVAKINGVTQASV
jgi:hypothetical protein